MFSGMSGAATLTASWPWSLLAGHVVRAHDIYQEQPPLEWFNLMVNVCFISVFYLQISLDDTQVNFNNWIVLCCLDR